MISLTDDGLDRVALNIGQVHLAGVQPGRQGNVFGGLDARSGYNVGTYWCALVFFLCFWR